MSTTMVAENVDKDHLTTLKHWMANADALTIRYAKYIFCCILLTTTKHSNS